jgi:hypothetical protein
MTPLQRNVEGLNIVLVGEAILMEAEKWVSACECCGDNAALALDYLLDALTGCEPGVTEYVMCRPVRCPACSSEILEKMLIAV